MKRCEDCGEPARWKTADGVWLCEGDFDLLFDYMPALSDVVATVEGSVPVLDYPTQKAPGGKAEGQGCGD